MWPPLTVPCIPRWLLQLLAAFSLNDTEVESRHRQPAIPSVPRQLPCIKERAGRHLNSSMGQLTSGMLISEKGDQIDIFK